LYHQVLQPVSMRICLVSAILLLVLLGSLHSAGVAQGPAEMIRVAIVKSAPSVTLSGEGLLALSDKGTPLVLNPPVAVKAGKDVLVIDGIGYRRVTFSASSAVYVNGKPYRGVAELLPAEKGILVVNELALDDYLVGLINCEISSAWPIEAVKAQAVIARTYALYRKEIRKASVYHLESSVIDQVYDGCEIEDSRAQRAVSDTAGEVLAFDNRIIQAFYHSNCGGRTEAAENVWGAAIPYLKGVDCQYCLAGQASSWEQRLSLHEIEDRLRVAGRKIGTLLDVKAGPRNHRGRLKSVNVVTSRGEHQISGDQFRKAVGYGVIKSTNFTVRVANGEAFFSGAGNGHGVGLCQWGGKQRALDGFNYAEILSYYYPGTELKKLSDIR